MDGTEGQQWAANPGPENMVWTISPETESTFHSLALHTETQTHISTTQRHTIATLLHMQYTSHTYTDRHTDRYTHHTRRNTQQHTLHRDMQSKTYTSTTHHTNTDIHTHGTYITRAHINCQHIQLHTDTHRVLGRAAKILRVPSGVLLDGPALSPHSQLSLFCSHHHVHSHVTTLEPG